MWHVLFSDGRSIKYFDSDTLSGREAHVRSYDYFLFIHLMIVQKVGGKRKKKSVNSSKFGGYQF